MKDGNKPRDQLCDRSERLVAAAAEEQSFITSGQEIKNPTNDLPWRNRNV